MIQSSVPHPLRQKAPRESVKLVVHTELVAVNVCIGPGIRRRFQQTTANRYMITSVKIGHVTILWIITRPVHERGKSYRMSQRHITFLAHLRSCDRLLNWQA